LESFRGTDILSEKFAKAKMISAKSGLPFDKPKKKKNNVIKQN